MREMECFRLTQCLIEMVLTGAIILRFPVEAKSFQHGERAVVDCSPEGVAQLVEQRPFKP